MISTLSHLAPTIRHTLLKTHTTLIFSANLQLISLHCHLSSDHIFIHMLHSLRRTYHTWLQNATPFFNFKSGDMPFVLTSSNLCQQPRASRHTRTSLKSIMESTNFSSHQTIIINTSQQNKMMKRSQEHSQFIFVKDTTVSLSKAPKSHVKLGTHMHYDNGFEIFIAVIFNMSPQLGGLWPKAQDLVIQFCLGEG